MCHGGFNPMGDVGAGYNTPCHAGCLAAITPTALPQGKPGGFACDEQWRVAKRSVHAGDAVVPEPLDLVLHLQFSTLEFHYFQIIDRGMGQAIVDFLFECPVPFFQFRKVRLHRHAVCLLNQWL
jgi:hypothetical protein